MALCAEESFIMWTRVFNTLAHALLTRVVLFLGVCDSTACLVTYEHFEVATQMDRSHLGLFHISILH